MQKLDGIFSRMIYQDKITGDARFEVETSMYGPIICEGMIPNFDKWTPIQMYGYKKEDVFTASKTVVHAHDEGNSMRFLQSRRFPYLTDEQLHTILEVAGFDIFKYADYDEAVERLVDTERIACKDAEHIIRALRETTGFDKLLHLVHLYGGNLYSAEHIRDTVGTDRGIRMGNKDPYGFVFYGCPFSHVDAIHKDKAALDQRGAALIYTILSKKKQKNMEIRALLQDVRNVIPEMDQNMLSEILSKYDDRFVVEDFGIQIRVYDMDFFRMDKGIVGNVLRILSTAKTRCVPESFITELEDRIGCTFTESQNEVFASYKNGGLILVQDTDEKRILETVNGLLMLANGLDKKAKTAVCTADHSFSAGRDPVGTDTYTVEDMLTYGDFPRWNTILPKRVASYMDLIIVTDAQCMDRKTMEVFLASMKDGATVILFGSTGVDSAFRELMSVRGIASHIFAGTNQNSLTTEVTYALRRNLCG